MSNRRKNAQNCWFFRRPPSSFLSKNLMNGFIKAAFIFGGHELFLLGRHELILFELELFTNCSELTRQLMGINGETFLAGSAPKKN